MTWQVVTIEPPIGKTQLRAIRLRKGLTQEAMADWLGISWRQYQRLEAGHCKVSGPIARLLRE